MTPDSVLDARINRPRSELNPSPPRPPRRVKRQPLLTRTPACAALKQALVMLRPGHAVE